MPPPIFRMLPKGGKLCRIRCLYNISERDYLGSLYALIAIGCSMVYGILRLINFAHGKISCWSLFRLLGDNSFPSAVGSSCSVAIIATAFCEFW